ASPVLEPVPLQGFYWEISRLKLGSDSMIKKQESNHTSLPPIAGKRHLMILIPCKFLSRQSHFHASWCPPGTWEFCCIHAREPKRSYSEQMYSAHTCVIKAGKVSYPHLKS